MKLLRIHYGGLVTPLLIDFGVKQTQAPKEQDSDSIIMLVICYHLQFTIIHPFWIWNWPKHRISPMSCIDSRILHCTSWTSPPRMQNLHPPAYGFILARCQSTNWMVRLVLMVATAAFTSFGTTSPEGSNGFQMNRTEDGLQVAQVYSVKPTPNLGKQKVWPEGQLQITEI